MIEHLSSKQRKEFKKWQIAKDIPVPEKKGDLKLLLEKALPDKKIDDNFMYSHVKRRAMLDGIDPKRIIRKPRKGNSENPWRPSEGVAIVSEEAIKIKEKIDRKKEKDEKFSKMVDDKKQFKAYIIDQIEKREITVQVGADLQALYHGIDIWDARKLGLMQFKP